MFGKHAGRQPSRLPVKSRVINQAAEGAEMEIVTSAPLASMRLGKSWMIRLASNLLGIGMFRIGASDIAPRTGTVPNGGAAFRVEWDGSNLVQRESFTLQNWTGMTLKANKYGWFVRYESLRWVLCIEC